MTVTVPTWHNIRVIRALEQQDCPAKSGKSGYVSPPYEWVERNAQWIIRARPASVGAGHMLSIQPFSLINV